MQTRWAALFGLVLLLGLALPPGGVAAQDKAGQKAVPRPAFEHQRDEPPFFGQPAVILYEHADFKGRWAVYFDDSPRLADFGVSAVRLVGGAVAALFSERGYGGRAQTFVEDEDNLSVSRVGNDQAGSIRVYRSGSHVVLYESPGYKGRSEVFEGAATNLENTLYGRDRVFSLRVKNATATLFRGTGFTGQSQTFEGDVRDMNQTRFGGECLSLRLTPKKAAGPLSRAPRPGRLNLARGAEVTGQDVSGAISAVNDGLIFTEGTDPQAQPSAGLADKKAFIRLDLGRIHGLKRLTVWAEADDAYAVSFSVDGRNWDRTVTCPPAPGFGFRRRDVFVEAVARYLMIQAEGDKAPHSLAEVEVYGRD